jgi:carbon monoxide dehydrogenase subunit G
MAATPLEFSGEEQFRASPEELYALLTDLHVLAANIPDVTQSQVLDERTLSCTVRPGLSFLRGTLKLLIHLEENQPPTMAAMKIDAKGIGQAMRVQSRFSLEPTEPGTRLTWTAQVAEMKGLVATVSASLVRGAAEQVIRHAWSQIRGQLGESAKESTS